MTNITLGNQILNEREPLISRWIKNNDRNLLIAITTLFVIGIILSFSTAPIMGERHNREPFTYAQRHIIIGVFSYGIMVFMSFFSLTQVRRFGLGLFLVVMVGIILLPFFGTDFAKGATRWYSLGFISVQPTEFLKPAFIVVCAWLLAGSLEPMGPRGKSISFLITTLVIAVLVIQPDFGLSAIIIALWGTMFFVTNGSLGILLIVGFLAVVGFTLAYSYSEHFARRINDYFAVLAGNESHAQVSAAIKTIFEGGVMGVGAGKGTKKWYLPEAHTDFIIAVAAEEYGLFMVFFIISIFVYILLRSTKLIKNTRNPFNEIAVIGLAVSVNVQAFVHVAANINLIPVKGMTLPFISYGGSSMVATSITLGLLLALLRHVREDQVYEDKLQNK